MKKVNKNSLALWFVFGGQTAPTPRTASVVRKSYV